MVSEIPQESRIKVATLTSGRTDPSSRFRIYQHVGPLKEFGIDVREYVPFIDKYSPLPLWPKNLRASSFAFPVHFVWQGVKLAARIPGIFGSRQSDITWLQRDLLPGCPTLEFLLKKPLVFDVDDAIWLHPPLGRQSLAATARRADVVIAGNNYIASWFEPYSKLIHVVPTAIDIEKFKPCSSSPASGDGRYVIGWMGSFSTLKYLESIEQCLRKFMMDHPGSELLVVANGCPKFKTLPVDRFRYIPWSENVEVAALRSMDVGIMPLPDDEWTRGKCSFKMLQYMACGIPSIVSPVGMNVEVLSRGRMALSAGTDSEWYDALSFFHGDSSAAKEYGSAGRIVAEKYFSRKIISEQIASIFKGLL